MLGGVSFAEAYDSYILKYEGEDDIHVITAKEKENLLSNTGAGISICADNEKNIEYIEPNYEVFLYDNDGETNWNVSMINANSSWDYGCYGNGIKIAVLDSGVNVCEGLKDSVISGYNVINYSDDVSDNIGHGTVVCGIISNSADNESSVGISQKATVVPIKCFDKNYTTKVDKIAEALEYVIDNVDCKIINMSFGLNGNSAYLKSKINSALQKGIIVVAAVGNGGSNTLRYPAAYDGVIGVGAVDSEYSWCDFSQHNKSVDVVAPGKDIDVIKTNDYAKGSGTSFAVPHIAAAAALALSIDSEMTPENFFELLQITSTDLGDEGYDEYYGYGLINMEKMTERLVSRSDVFMSPVNFDGDKYTVIIKNNTENTLNAINVMRSQDGTMCKITPLELRPNKKTSLTVDTNFSGTIKCFLWRSLDSMKALTLCREHIR